MMTRKYLCYLTTATVVSFLPLPLILGGLFPLMKVLPPAFFRLAAGRNGTRQRLWGCIAPTVSGFRLETA